MSNLLSTRLRCATVRLSRRMLHGTVIGGSAGERPKLCRTSVLIIVGPVVVEEASGHEGSTNTCRSRHPRSISQSSAYIR
jgi:hypothetical protein